MSVQWFDRAGRVNWKGASGWTEALEQTLDQLIYTAQGGRRISNKFSKTT